MLREGLSRVPVTPTGSIRITRDTPEVLSRSRFSRQQENGHPDRKHPDRYLAVEAGEHGIVRTAPTLEARDRLRG